MCPIHTPPEVLTSGRLDTLEELTFIQGCDDLGVTFTDIVSAKLPALRCALWMMCRS